MVRAAIEDIEQQITAGHLSVAATLVDEGSPPGHVFDGQHHDPIPTDVTRLRCRIPREWVGTSVGGWLFFESGFQRGLPAGPRYCNPTFLQREVKALWKKPAKATPTVRPRPSIAKLERFMAEQVRRAQGELLPRDKTIKKCCEDTGATVRQASDAWNKLDASVKRPAFRPRLNKSNK
jgi:hypothetical protein